MSVESVRAKVLDAALELFATKGYGGTSIDEIAVASGMKAPNLYKYFKGKLEIFELLQDRASEVYKSRMNLLPESVVHIHSKEELKEFSMHQITYTMSDENIRKFRQLFTVEQYRSDYLKTKTSEYQMLNITNLYIKIFTYMMEQGTLKKCDPELLAMEYCAPVTLLIQLCDRQPDRFDECIKKVEKYIDFFIAKTF